MDPRKLALIAGISYLIIFFAAIFGNFFVLETILNDPITAITQNDLLVRFGILAFLITVVFDVIVAWALGKLFINHHLTTLSTYFRMMHAAIMGVAIFALVLSLQLTTSEEILYQANVFNVIWLIGLFFFGFHLILLGNILGKPRWIAIFLALAGVMYIVDTSAHILLPNYENHKDLFLALVAIPSIIGEMTLTIWLLIKGGKD